MVIYQNSNEFQNREKLNKYQEYIEALEQERIKIQVFERELPLCLQLVSQAIERCRKQMAVPVRINESFDGQSDDDETLSDQFPILEEFIPMKLTSYINKDVDDQLKQKKQLSCKSKIICRKDWLASAQLSIQASDPHLEEKLFSSMEEDRNGCETLHLFQKKKTSNGSSADTGGGGDGGGNRGGSNGEYKGQSNKKARRCWSQELHRRFLNALQQLGGAHVATPKQIREFMKVDGLTNDEIKSHLQKYRLHTRRLRPAIYAMHTPQLVVVGRLWMPPLDYTTNDPTSPRTDGIKNAKALPHLYTNASDNTIWEKKK